MLGLVRPIIHLLLVKLLAFETLGMTFVPSYNHPILVDFSIVLIKR